MTTAAQLDFRNTNSLWGSVLVETLVRLGLRQVVISPGSRSAPLTFAFARHPRVESIPVLDERSAAFFALGLAKQRKRPVALVCTSGTAAANFLPAIVEAHESGVPLLVLTADRPPELRDCHSGQTIDQQKLYGGYVNFYHELAVPEALLPMLRYLRQTVAHAFERTVQPAMGAVHLNCPFRDPLPPLPEKLPAEITTAALEGFFDGVEELAENLNVAAAVTPLVSLGRRYPASRVTTAATLSGGPATRAGPTERGLIIVGPNEPAVPHPFAQNVGRISRALGWPVLADALSPVRNYAADAGHVVAHYDAILRSEKLAEEFRPERVLCIGGWPTSKALRSWLQQADPETVIVTERATNEDALHLRSGYVRAGLDSWAASFRGQRRLPAYAKRWLGADAVVRRSLSAEFKKLDALVEAKCVDVLARNLPSRTTCFFASSMPVRDAEYFWPASNKAHVIHFNRGANGIDGTLSTALGVAHGHRQPAVLLTGDLALLHDTNGFLSVPKFKGSLTVVLINNNGGGIFEHLPVAQFEPPFEEFFATPQHANFPKLCAAYDVEHVLVKDWTHLARLVAKLPARGVRVLELRTDRKRDAAWRKALFARLAEKLG